MVAPGGTNKEFPSEAQCKRSASVFDEVLEPAFRYADRKRLAVRPFASYFKAEELWEGFPDGWEENVLGMLAAGAVFTRPERIAAFLRSMKEKLRSGVVAMVRAWRTRPWVWAFFEVIEDLGDRRLRVVPIGAPPSTWSDTECWNEMLLYSRTVTENHYRGSRIFFTQLVDTGPAFATYGAIIPFQGLEEVDVLSMAHIVRHANRPPGSVPLLGVVDFATPVSDIVASNPIPFLAMLRYSETPPVRTPEGAPGRYASWATLPDIPDPWSEISWRDAAEAAGERVAAVVFDDEGGGIALGDGSPMYDPAIYLSREDECAFLEARTRVGYERGRASAARIAEFPETPEVAAGILAVAAAAQIVGLDETLLDQCGALRERYEAEIVKASPQEPIGVDDEEPLPSSMDEFQAIADRLVNNHNEGIHEETETIAADLGVVPDLVDSVRRQLESSFSRMFAGEGDLPGADRFGLSPRAFAQLARGGVPNVAGVIRLRDTAELRNAQGLLAEAPYQRGALWLMERAMSDQGLPATQAGYISPAVVNEAHEARIVRSFADILGEQRDDAGADSHEIRERLRPKKEAEWPGLLRLRSLAESAHLLKLSGKIFRLTEITQRLVDDPAALYHHLLVTAFRTFEWAVGDRFDPPPELHRMAGFLFYAAGALCDARRSGARDGATALGDTVDSDWVPLFMLADRFVATIPSLAQAVSEEASAADDGERRSFGMGEYVRVAVRAFFVDQLGVQFGLLESNDRIGEEAAFRTTPLYEAVFERE